MQFAPTWLIGTGFMGIEYAKVLNALNIPYTCIGRSTENCKKFQEATKQEAFAGGLDKILAMKPATPMYAIVAVGIENLFDTTTKLLKLGVKKILLEKPGFGEVHELKELVACAQENEAEVYLAYNRRFYASTRAAQKMIAEDGGVSSFNFEFTEWSHTIKDLNLPAVVHQNWFMGNSSHVIDMAFFLGGEPQELASFVGGTGELPWHTRSSVFAGAGKAKNNALFSYQANWQAPGRWCVEILTKKHRLIFRPLEKLQAQKIGSVAIDYINDIDYSLDELFKPGLYLQTKSFFENNTNDFCTLSEQFEYIKLYCKMSNYTFNL